MENDGKNLWEKKTQIMGKPMENPEFDGGSSFGPVFMALFCAVYINFRDTPIITHI